MGRDEENKDIIDKRYPPDYLYSWTNKNHTEFRIYHRLDGRLLWSGSNLIAAEAWLSRHLLPPAMPQTKIQSAIADAFKRSDSQK